MPKVIPAHLSTADTCRCILHDTETKFKMFNFFLHVGLESDRFLYRNQFYISSNCRQCGRGLNGYVALALSGEARMGEQKNEPSIASESDSALRDRRGLQLVCDYKRREQAVSS